MAIKKNKAEPEESPFSDSLTDDLRGRQSVRATFRLSEKAIEAISIVATHLGIKQKSLFDQLIEDIRSLNLIASKMDTTAFLNHRKTQKTFVLNRKTLSSIERISKDYNAPRDMLVELSILRLFPIINQEKEKHRNRKKLLERLKNYSNQGKKILLEADTLLGRDDPVYGRLETIVAACEHAVRCIEDFIERCSTIEDFNAEMLE